MKTNRKSKPRPSQDFDKLKKKNRELLKKLKKTEVERDQYLRSLYDVLKKRMTPEEIENGAKPEQAGGSLLNMVERLKRESNGR